MPAQLRRYTINRGKLGEFVAAWKNGVYPLRTKMGYRIQAWTIKDRNEFVWILGYDGPDEWEVKERAYYGSPERAALNPDPAQFIARAESWFLEPIVRES